MWSWLSNYCLYWLQLLTGISHHELLMTIDQLRKRNAELEQKVNKLNIALAPHGTLAFIKAGSLAGSPAGSLPEPGSPGAAACDEADMEPQLRAVLTKLQHLEKDNARLQRESSTLQRQLHSSREQEAGLRRTVAGLQGEVAKLKALNDQTAGETAELLAALSSLRQSQSQLAGDLHIKEEMLELVQQQLSEVAAINGLTSGPLPTLSASSSMAYEEYAAVLASATSPLKPLHRVSYQG